MDDDFDVDRGVQSMKSTAMIAPMMMTAATGFPSFAMRLA